MTAIPFRFQYVNPCATQYYLPQCRIYASMNWVIIDPGNGLSPVQRLFGAKPVLAYCRLDSWEHI